MRTFFLSILPVVLLAHAFLTLALEAQETPTERQAAVEVLRKMSGLEKSLDIPALTARVTGPSPQRDKVVARARQLMETDLLAMGDEITRAPEIGFQEDRSIRTLMDYLNRHGFVTEAGVAGLRTAFVGRYKRAGAFANSPGPNLGVILEYDALRGTKGAFHGDQHSTQGPIGAAVAIAVAEYLERAGLPGNVVVFGTPGEEMMPPAAKTQMFDAGVFRNMDVIVRSHAVNVTTRPAPGFGTCCMNIDGVRYTFSGAPAHQMTAWAGRNALEGVIHLFENIDSIRANLRPEARIQGVITEGGAAPNVVPDRAVADFYIRYPDAVYLAQVREFVDNAARAAALSTGTKVASTTMAVCAMAFRSPRWPNQLFLHEEIRRHKRTGRARQTFRLRRDGSVSSVIPGIGFSAQTSTFANHTYEMEKDALAGIGHHGFVVDAESMAALLFDFATQPDYRAAVQQEFAGIKALFGDYQEALKKVYPVPNVPDPK